MRKESIPSPDWDTPRAVKAGGFIFLSGMTSKNPGGGYEAPGDIVVQLHVIIKRIEENLAAAGATLDDVVKVVAYIDDSKKHQQFNAAYLEHFRQNRPARTTIQAGGFEEGACIELDVIAISLD